MTGKYKITQFIAQFPSGRDIWFHAVWNDRVIGQLKIGYPDQPKSAIYDVYVDEVARGQGIAGSLMEHALKWFVDNNKHEMYLHVSLKNKPVVEWYRRMGFCFNGGIDELTGNNWMVLDLKSHIPQK